MTSAAAASAAAVSSAPSSALSPHAAPFTLPSRPGAAPPGRRHDGEVSMPMDGSFVVCAEERKSRDTHSASPIACILTNSTVYPPSTNGMHAVQPSSWAGVCMDAYPSSPSVRITPNYKQRSPLTSGSGSKCSTVKIERPRNKTSETDKNSCGFRSKLVIAENPKSNKDTGKETSFPRNLQVSNPIDDNDNSQGTMMYSKEANPVFNVKPLHIPTTSADPCGFVADDVKPDPSECSVDSPCYRGASASRLSRFDALETPAPQSTKQASEAFGTGQKQSSSTVRHYEAPPELQNLVTGKTKNDHFQSHIEVGVSKKSGDVSINQTKDSHGKELECANQCAEKCDTEKKHLLEPRDNYLKRSSLNSAAPDFVPSSVGKSKIGKGPCSSTGRNILGVLKAIETLTEVLQNSYSDDEIEPEEHDYILLESVIDNLQTCLHKTRKGPIKGASDKAGSKAPRSQTTVLKSDAGKYNGSYIADGGKGIIINNFAGSSHMLNDFGRNSLTRGCQPSLNNVPKKISCDKEQVLVYKNLWIEAERANCELKYQLKHIYIKINLESSMAPIGGPRKNCFQVSDLGTDPSNLYGAVLAHSPMLSFPKDQLTGETSGSGNSQNLLFAGDGIQSGGNTTLPKNLQHDHVLTGFEETITHRHAHPGLQLAPNRSRRELNRGTLDGTSACSYITEGDGILCGNSEYGSSDWEHVLTEENGWS